MSTPQPPAVSTAAARAYGFLPDPLVAHDPAGDFPLLALIAALAAGSDEVYAFAEDPGAGVYLDPRTAPPRWLRWLGLPVGVRVDPRVSDAFPDPALVEAARWEITEAPYMDRGPEAYLRAKLAPLLIDGARVRVRPFTAPGVDGRQPHHLTVEIPLDDVRPEHIDGYRAAENLVRNPALTPGTTGWYARHTTIARSTAHPGTGTFSLRVQNKTTGPWGDIGPHAWTPLAVLDPGTRVRMAVQVTNPDTVPACAPLMLQTGGLWPQLVATSSVLLMPGETRIVTIDAVIPQPPDWTDVAPDLGTWEDIGDTFDSWLELYAGVPNWASFQDAAARLVLGGPLHPTTGDPLPGAALAWADAHANTGRTLHRYGHGDLADWAWTDGPYLSASTAPDTRASATVARRIKTNVPAGLLSHLELNVGRATWQTTAERIPRWDALPPISPTWQAAADAYHGIET